MQISLQFDEFFDRKKFKILISRRFEIFTKNFHLKLVGTPCTCIIKRKYMSHEITTKGGQVYQIIVNVSCLLRNISHYSMSCGLQWWDVTVFEIPITKVSFYNIVHITHKKFHQNWSAGYLNFRAQKVILILNFRTKNKLHIVNFSERNDLGLKSITVKIWKI